METCADAPAIVLFGMLPGRCVVMVKSWFVGHVESHVENVPNETNVNRTAIYKIKTWRMDYFVLHLLIK